MTDIETLKQALRTAQDGLIKATRDLYTARSELEAKHAPIVNAAREAALAAKRNLDDAIAAGASHPWAGKVVKRMAPETRYSSRLVEQRGIVEISGPNNPWPGSRYGAPEAGDPVVRLMKKDGTLGAKQVHLHSYDKRYPWSLVETEEAKP